jgi:ABC-type nitrate/sulfonate/bicarbonate transport system substrate-binding protein
MIRTVVAATLIAWVSGGTALGQASPSGPTTAKDAGMRQTMTSPTLSALQPVNLVYAEATGSFLVLLAIAQQQGLFEKHGLEVHTTVARGATVPKVTNDVLVGFIGEPAAILQAAEGSDVRIVASFSRTPLSGYLVGRPDIRAAPDLRGKRIGVRVLGAGLWISTVLALEQLGLDPRRDGIALVPVGSPGEILRALEEGAIDAALLPVAQSRRLRALGYHVLLEDYPQGLTAYGGGLVTTAAFLESHPEIIEKIISALAQAHAFGLAEKNLGQVMEAFKSSLGIADRETAIGNLRELLPKPYPSRSALESMQRVMSLHDPRVLNVEIDRLMDDSLVKKLDEAGRLD